MRSPNLKTSILALVFVLTGCFGESSVLAPSRGGPEGTTPPLVIDPVTGEPVVVTPPVDPVVVTPPEELPEFKPAPLRLRALLGWQYRNAIRSLLGAEAGAAVTPPPDSAMNGFESIGAAQLSLAPSAVSAYEASALKAAEVALANVNGRAALVGCTPASASDEACLRTFLGKFGQRAFRRPLTTTELNAYVTLGKNAGTAYADFHKGLAFVISTVLQSPNFLYLVESGEVDPAEPTRLRLTGYEMASRLSFFLVGGPPDDALLAAAKAGELSTADGVRTQARRLVSLPEAKTTLNKFFDEWMHLKDLEGMSRDAATYPNYTPALAQAMGEETRRFLESVAWGDRDFRDLFDANYTFVNTALGKLYALDGAPASGFGQVTLPEATKRGGILGQAAFLSLNSHARRSSPTYRGRFVRERVLCEVVPAPPDDVNTNFEEPAPGAPALTARERLSEHRSNPSCAGCHAMMDDIGLGLENFDAIGQFRTTEDGTPIDPISKLDRVGSFDGPRSLGALLRQDARTTGCFVRNVFRMASGHVDTTGESRSMAAVTEAFKGSNYRVKELLVEIAASDAFRLASAEVTP